jgi:hypothetical protein
VIQTINDRFVCTTITLSELKKIVKSQDDLAMEVAASFFGPVEMIFLSSEGHYVTKLTVVNDLTDIHPDTDIRAGQRRDASPERNMAVFLKRVEDHFGKTP